MKLDISLESENDSLLIAPTDDFVGETVRIVFPDDVFKGKPQRFIKSHAKTINAKVTIEPDGTVVFTMLAKDRDKIVNKLRKDLAQDAYLMTKGKWKLDFVRSFSFSPDYKEMIIYVDAEAYENASKGVIKHFDIDGFAYDCGRIQLYNGENREEITVNIVIKDNETDKEIKRTVHNVFQS